jgi:hypothetical protein
MKKTVHLTVDSCSMTLWCGKLKAFNWSVEATTASFPYWWQLGYDGFERCSECNENIHMAHPHLILKDLGRAVL